MLAANIVDQISPSIERLKLAVGGQGRFRLSNSGINEDGEVIDKIENLADAYRPLLMMIQKLGAVAEVAAPK